MNAIDLLKQDHRVVDSLFSKVEGTPPSQHEALFKRINGELQTHAHVEEKIFYPACKKAGNKELVDIVLEGIEEHLQMKMFLGQLDGMSSKKEVFEPKLKVLIEDTRHHVKEEEREMFKMAEDQLGAETLEKLGKKMEAEKVKFQKANNITPEDPAEHEGVVSGLISKAVDAVSSVISPGGGAKKKSPQKSVAKSGNGGTKTTAKAPNGGKQPSAKAASGKTKNAGGTRRSAAKASA